jgi:hypothetical protein
MAASSSPHLAFCCLSLAPSQAYVSHTSVTHSQDGSTPLYIAAERGCLAAVELLIAARADVNAEDKVCFWPQRSTACKKIQSSLSPSLTHSLPSLRLSSKPITLSSPTPPLQSGSKWSWFVFQYFFLVSLSFSFSRHPYLSLPILIPPIPSSSSCSLRFPLLAHSLSHKQTRIH